MVVLAELQIFCSRPHAPTWRVALGDADLPCEPAPGFGGILLGGIVAANVGAIDPDLIPDLQHLTRELEAGRRSRSPASAIASRSTPSGSTPCATGCSAKVSAWCSPSTPTACPPSTCSAPSTPPVASTP